MAKDLTEALQALTEQATGQTSRVDKRLAASKSATAIPERGGASKPLGSLAGSIASPLSETDYGAREWWSEQTVTTTDGIFAIRLRPVKKIAMTDANMQPVEFGYAEPV